MDRAKLVYYIIRSNPGIRAQEIANMSGLTLDEVESALADTEQTNCKLSEGGDGGLYCFARTESD